MLLGIAGVAGVTWERTENSIQRIPVRYISLSATKKNNTNLKSVVKFAFRPNFSLLLA